MVETIKVIEPQKRFSTQFDVQIFTGVVEIAFTPLEGSTRIAQKATLKGKTFIWRVLLPILKPIMQKEQMAHLDALAVLIEESPSTTEAALSKGE